MSIWTLAMDCLVPGVVDRRDRIRACLEHRNASLRREEALTLKGLSSTLEIKQRDLMYYIKDDPKRVNAVTTGCRTELARVLGGHASCEPWLTNGTWSLPSKTMVAPKWLIATGVQEKTRVFVRWMLLASHRRIAAFRKSNRLIEPFALDFLHVLDSKHTSHAMAFGNAHAWDPGQWEQYLPELARAETEVKAAFAAFLRAMIAHKVWHQNLAEIMPFEAGRAYEAFEWEQRLAQSSVTSPSVYRPLSSPAAKPR